MASISDIPERHVVIDRRPGHYLSFPDVCLAPDNALVVAYREADKHVPGRKKLLSRRSRDLGRSWSAPFIMNAALGHCPRLTRLTGGEIVAVDDDGPTLYWSMDHGRTFAQARAKGLAHGLPDRIIELSTEHFLTAAHLHRGTFPNPKTRQPTTEQMCYLSANRGGSFEPLSVMAYDPNLVLCEASMFALPGGEIFALLRENSSVFEPMYLVVSTDQGRTWSRPAPTPLIGHRPTAGLTSDGRLLVTYRNVSPWVGTSAWLGRVDELGDFEVHGSADAPGVSSLSEMGLRVVESDLTGRGVGYALRPMSDPERARAELEIVVTPGDPGGLILNFGIPWRVLPGSIRPEAKGARAIATDKGRLKLLFVYEDGQVTLRVNGKRRATRQVEPRSADTRVICLGCLESDGEGEPLPPAAWTLHSLRQRVVEPGYGRSFDLFWDPSRGLPDRYVRERVLMLGEGHGAHGADLGYSGWVELPDGDFFCAYHQADGRDPDYRPGKVSWVMGCRFSRGDFSIRK